MTTPLERLAIKLQLYEQKRLIDIWIDRIKNDIRRYCAINGLCDARHSSMFRLSILMVMAGNAVHMSISFRHVFVLTRSNEGVARGGMVKNRTPNPDPVPAAPIREPDTRMRSQRKGRSYLGSWAEQMVVARLAMNKTRNAMRITTTPPTVIRSHRSELSRISNSGFPCMTIALISNFTAVAEVCSDHHHTRNLRRPLALKRNEHQSVSPYFSIESRLL